MGTSLPGRDNDDSKANPPPLFFQRKMRSLQAKDSLRLLISCTSPPPPTAFAFLHHVDLKLQCNCKKLGYFGSHPALKPLLLLEEFFTL